MQGEDVVLVERGGYVVILRGQLSEDEVAAIHERYDVHFMESPHWDATRARGSG
jgi:hypothetical protein